MQAKQGARPNDVNGNYQAKDKNLNGNIGTF